MIDQLTILVNENKAIAFIFSVVCIMIAFYARRQYQGIKAAEYMVKEGQFLPLEQVVIDEATSHAEKEGNVSEFLSLLSEVRRRYGHNGVRGGHLYWIWGRLENIPSDIQGMDIPSFEKPKEN